MPCILYSANKSYKAYTCEIGDNVFVNSRICKSKFIANNPRYNYFDIEVIINKKDNLIELYVNEENSFSSHFTYSFNEYYYNNGLALGYDKFIVEYFQGKNNNIDINGISLGYELLYDKFGVSFYYAPSMGFNEYSVDISKSGYFIGNRIGVRKKISAIKLSIFMNFRKDFIDKMGLNIFTWGLSFGF